MEKNLDERRKELLARLTRLPETEKDAMVWLITHYNLAEQICRAEILTEAERDNLREAARRKGDSLLFLLVKLETLLHSTPDGMNLCE